MKGFRLLFGTIILTMAFSILAYGGTGYVEPDMSSSYYQDENFIFGQDTWYVNGRVKEKLGFTLPHDQMTRDANQSKAKISFRGPAYTWWYDNVELFGKQAGFSYGYEPKANSIMVWASKSNGNGHVAFCENVIGNTVYYTEAGKDFVGFNGEKKVTKGNEAQPMMNFLGYIYLDGAYRPLPDGNYAIISAMPQAQDSQKGMDIEGRSFDNSAQVILYPYDAQENQIFHLSYVGEGYYTIEVGYSNKVLDAEGATWKDAAGHHIIQYEYHGGENQLWKIEKTEDGYYTIVSKIGNYVIDVKAGSTANGAEMILWEKNGQKNQQFDFIKLD